MSIPDIRNEYRFVNWVLAGVLVVLVTAPVVVNMWGRSAFYLPACSIVLHTGRQCAACGLTHSVVAFYRGDFELSMKWHPAGRLLVVLIFVQLLLRVLYRAGRAMCLPWIDIGQLLLTGLLFRCVLIRSEPFRNCVPLPICQSAVRAGARAEFDDRSFAHAGITCLKRNADRTGVLVGAQHEQSPGG